MQVGLKLRSVAAVIAATTLAWACGGGGGGLTNLAKEQTLRINQGVEPGSLDPGQTQWNYEAGIDRNISEALLKGSADLKDVVPAAAESYSVSSDGLTYTFKLRKNGKYSDGQPVKAQDFVYSWQRLIDPRLAAPYADFFSGSVKGGEEAAALDPKKDASKIDAALQGLGLKAVDDYTFQVTLPTAQGYFKWIATLWNGAPIRKDVIDKYGSDKWWTKPETLITNGPFKVSEIVAKDHITMVPNTNYWGYTSGSYKPNLTKIVSYEIDDENAAFAKYQNGELEMVGVPLANTQLVKNDPKLSKELHSVPEGSMFWLYFNTAKAPFTNVKVRQAFAKGVDRNAYVNDILQGRAVASSTFIPKGSGGYAQDSLGSIQAFDAAAAKQLLADSGVPQSQLNSIHYLVRNTPTNKQVAEFIQGQFKTNLGINVTIDLIDSKTVSKRLRTGDYQLAGAGGWLLDYPDQQDWFDIFRTGDGNNFDKWSNKQYDDLVKQADSTTDQKKRDDLYLQAHKILVTDAPVAFMYQRLTFGLRKPYVAGIVSTSLDDWPGDLYVSKIYITTH